MSELEKYPSKDSLGVEQDKRKLLNPEKEFISPLYRIPSSQSNNGAASGQLQRMRSRSADTLSLFSTDDFHELRHVTSHRGDVDDEPNGQSGLDKSYIPPTRLQKFWTRNKGLALVILAQIFGTVMNITTRLLESGGKGMHPFQILFARMSITSVLCMLYMWYKQIPDFPFGAKGVRLLLTVRATGGFFGVFGLYWSLQYLPLSDATVLTFLAPTLACYACSKLINEPFTRAEQIGGFVSLAGVVLIARPTYLFTTTSETSPPKQPTPPQNGTVVSTDAISITSGVTDAQRLAAVGMAMIGVLGAACAYTTIRWIGQRAHPLISVNYFGAWCTLVSTLALAFVPSIPFVLPSTIREWSLLLLIGIGGFLMQFLLTAGLRYEKSSRATNMVYSQMLFALAGDELIFGVSPGVWSLAGSALILGSAIVVAIQKEGAVKVQAKDQGDVTNEVNGANRSNQGGEEWGMVDEEMGLVQRRSSDVDREEERGRSRSVEMGPLSSTHETAPSGYEEVMDESHEENDSRGSVPARHTKT